MTNEELKDLYQRSSERSRELEMIARAGFTLSRQERNEFSQCVRRIGLAGRELWIAAGKPKAPEFECFYQEVGH